jgi:hypothetical protein
LLGLDFNAEEHGKVDGGGELGTENYQFGADLDFLIRDQMNIKGRYILEFFKDPNSIAGGDATHHLFSLEFRQRF